jgi:peptidoglycan/xylan/chitin deacetylase (PgdA/CDA1 family)
MKLTELRPFRAKLRAGLRSALRVALAATVCLTVAGCAEQANLDADVEAQLADSSRATSFSIPVVCYHAIVSSTTGTYQTSVANFKAQMAYLKTNGYTTLSLSQFQQIVAGTATAPSKAILLTFDDCSSDFYTNAYPVLQSYGMKATQFAVSGWIGGSGRLTSAQLKTIASGGIDVQNHTTAHAYLTNQNYATQYAAINNAGSAIKASTGKSVTALAYPYGAYNSTTTGILSSLGYTLGFTVNGGLCTASSGKYALPRLCIINTDTTTTFARKITSGY